MAEQVVVPLMLNIQDSATMCDLLIPQTKDLLLSMKWRIIFAHRL